MKTKSGILNILFVLLLFLTATAFAETDKVEHDNSKLSVFLQPAISFISFEERKYFQNTIDTIYREFYSQALTESESLMVAKQDFQKVNFCFPITAGIQLQTFQDHFLSLGLGFIYDKESVVLTDRRNKNHNYDYTIQGVPLFLEYRLGIPKNLMDLTGESLFSLAFRWYWVLKGTEIYSTWGKIAAEKPAYGAGFGISLGYLITSWKSINIYGDVGYSSISVKSKDSFEKIVPNAPSGKAKWDIGGLQLQIRVSFGIIRNPVVEEDSVKQQKNPKDSLKTDNTKKDSTIKKDSTSAQDSLTNPADSTKTDTTIKTDTTAKTAEDTTAKVTADTTAKTPEKDSAAVTKPATDTTKATKTEEKTANNANTEVNAKADSNANDKANSSTNPAAKTEAKSEVKAPESPTTNNTEVEKATPGNTLPPAKKAVGP